MVLTVSCTVAGSYVGSKFGIPIEDQELTFCVF